MLNVSADYPTIQEVLENADDEERVLSQPQRDNTYIPGERPGLTAILAPYAVEIRYPDDRHML